MGEGWIRERGGGGGKRERARSPFATLLFCPLTVWFVDEFVIDIFFNLTPIMLSYTCLEEMMIECQSAFKHIAEKLQTLTIAREHIIIIIFFLSVPRACNKYCHHHFFFFFLMWLGVWFQCQASSQGSPFKQNLLFWIRSCTQSGIHSTQVRLLFLSFLFF